MSFLVGSKYSESKQACSAGGQARYMGHSNKYGLQCKGIKYDNTWTSNGGLKILGVGKHKDNWERSWTRKMEV
jgi:hypothetical protein